MYYRAPKNWVLPNWATCSHDRYTEQTCSREGRGNTVICSVWRSCETRLLNSKTQFFSHPVLFWFAFEGCFLIWFTPNILFDYNTEKVNVSQSHSWGIWTSKLPPWGFLAQVGGWDGWAEKDQTTRHNTTPDSRLNRIWRRELTAGVAEEHRGLLVAIAVGTRGELVWRGLHLVAHLG